MTTLAAAWAPRQAAALAGSAPAPAPAASAAACAEPRSSAPTMAAPRGSSFPRPAAATPGRSSLPPTVRACHCRKPASTAALAAMRPASPRRRLRRRPPHRSPWRVLGPGPPRAAALHAQPAAPEMPPAAPETAVIKRLYSCRHLQQNSSLAPTMLQSLQQTCLWSLLFLFVLPPVRLSLSSAPKPSPSVLCVCRMKSG